MSLSLRKAWHSRAPRERAVLAALAAALCVVLYAWLLLAAGTARGQLQASVGSLRAQAARLDQQALELGRLRALPAATASAGDLRALVQSRIGESGLSQALSRIEAPDPGHVTVVFGTVAFADWLAWVASLQAQRVRLESSRIEALAAPGQVSVAATFTRAGP